MKIERLVELIKMVLVMMLVVGTYACEEGDILPKAEPQKTIVIDVPTPKVCVVEPRLEVLDYGKYENVARVIVYCKDAKGRNLACIPNRQGGGHTCYTPGK